MSKNTKIAAGAVLALGLTAGAWSVYGGHSKHSKPTVTADAQEPAAPPASVPVAAPPKAVPSATPAKPVRTVGKSVDVTWYKLLSPKETRSDESPAAQQLREQMSTKLTGFFETTNLPEVYRKRTLDVLADSQAEYEALNEQVREFESADAYTDAVRTLDRNSVDELARFLSPDQLNALDNAIGLNTLHVFVAAKPFDLKTAPSN